MSTSKDIKGQLLHLELEANRLRQQIEAQSAVPEVRNGQIEFSVVEEDDWDFGSSKRETSAATKLLVESLSVLAKTGDRIKIGPYPNAEATRTVQSRLGYVTKRIMKWPVVADDNGLPLAPFESHIRKLSDGWYLYVMRLV